MPIKKYLQADNNAECKVFFNNANKISISVQQEDDEYPTIASISIEDAKELLELIKNVIEEAEEYHKEKTDFPWLSDS